MPTPLPTVVLGPVPFDGVAVRLRPARSADFTAWRRLRLRDEETISPYWQTDERAWSERHSERIWLRWLVEHRDLARAGRGISFVIEADGRFAGEIALHGVDDDRHSAELGIWVDRELAGRGLGGLASLMVMDYAAEVLGVRRLTAPISVDNRPAAAAAQRVGMVREATMVAAMDVGGRRCDHELWVLRTGGVPPALVARLSGVATTRSIDAALPMSVVRHLRVMPRSAGGAVALVRRRAGRARQRAGALLGATHPAEVVAGPVSLRDVGDHGRTARLHVEPASVTDTDADAEELGATIGAVVAEGFEHSGLRRIWTTCDLDDGDRSTLLAGAGLSREGILRDHRDADGRVGDHELWAATANDRGDSAAGRPGLTR